MRNDAMDTGSRGAPQEPSGLAARAAALDLLRAVVRKGRPLDEALAARADRLDRRDRAFARLLVATTLRRLGQIDRLLASFLRRPPPVAVVEDILRLGTVQLVFLGTPAHAAVGRMTELAGRRGPARLKGLVNAVLRRVAREGTALAEAQDAARLNTPDWLWESWCAAYGEPTCRAIAEAHLEEPPLDITAPREPARWAERLGARLLPTGTLRRPAGGPVADLPGYAEGAWWIQDAAAALPARLLGDVAGRRVIDLCAAPGGKTAQLAAAGARVTAVDRSPERLERLAENLSRLRLAAERVSADALHWRPEAPAEAVLLDAPCTATGAIRRHPDIARLKGPADAAGLAPVQDALLRAAAEMVAPGGVVVYCTCSLQPEEGPERVAALLAASDDVERMPVDADEVGGLAEIVTPEGDVRTLPCHLAGEGGLDGFYIARLRRR